MERLTLIAAFAALGWVASANAADNDLEKRVTASDGWVAYSVPMIASADGPCCHTVGKGAEAKKGCELDKRSWSLNNDRADPAVADNGTLAVYLKVERGRVARVRAVGASCPVHTASTVRWIEPVEATGSVALLSSLLDRKMKDDVDSSLMALAYHADPSAMRALTERAEPSHSLKEREQALFWLGQIRGAESADVIARYATTDPNPKLRTKAIFALSQSDAPNAYADILKIAHNDSDEEVRGEALFWLVQTDDPRAKDDIIASLKKESSAKVLDKAVFALSQLDDGAADEALIAVLRGDYSRAVKKQAMFWLGQSGSPRAMAYFDEALK
jgi:HEAT repeat protein